MDMWTSMLQPDISIIEKMLRPLVVYFFLLTGLRLAGKREFAQLNPMDLIVILTLSNTVQNAIIGPDNSLSGGIIGAVTLLAVNYATVRFLVTYPKVRRLVVGQPVVLIDHGSRHEDRMRRELVSRDELETAAHEKDIGSLDEVERAVLEVGGGFSFVSKDPTRTERRYTEINRRLDHIDHELASISSTLKDRR